MKWISNEELIEKAMGVARFNRISKYLSAGGVGCALLTSKNNVFLGVCIDATSGIGFCAEHTAIAAMLTNGEHSIRKIVAVSDKGTIMPPCGRCRELMYRVTNQDGDLIVILGKNKTIKLKELLPHPFS